MYSPILPRAISTDAVQYLDHVVHSIMLMRNIRKLVIKDWIEYLQKDPDIGPMVNARLAPKPYQIPQPMLELPSLTENPDLGEQAREAYDVAIERLQLVFAQSNIPNERHSKIRWLMAWPVMLGTAYHDRLEQRRPEALVILAHFGVLMLYYRDSWVVGDSGEIPHRVDSVLPGNALESLDGVSTVVYHHAGQSGSKYVT